MTRRAKPFWAGISRTPGTGPIGIGEQPTRIAHQREVREARQIDRLADDHEAVLHADFVLDDLRSDARKRECAAAYRKREALR